MFETTNQMVLLAWPLGTWSSGAAVEGMFLLNQTRRAHSVACSLQPP